MELILDAENYFEKNPEEPEKYYMIEEEVVPPFQTGNRG